MSRDMSQAQFKAKLESYGMKEEGFLGYVRIPNPVRRGSLQVSHHNAGPSRREKLRYLLSAKAAYEAREREQAQWEQDHADDIALWRQLSRGEHA